MEKIKRVLTQSEIQELRDLIEYTDDDRTIELFNKFHSIFNKLAIFYKEKKNEKNKNIFYWNEYNRIFKEKQKIEEKKELLKKQLDKEIQNNVELYHKYRELQIENEKLKR